MTHDTKIRIFKIFANMIEDHTIDNTLLYRDKVLLKSKTTKETNTTI